MYRLEVEKDDFGVLYLLEISIYSTLGYKRGEYKGIPTMKSKQAEDEAVELRESEQVETDVIVDDYKDLKIDMVASSRKNFLQWNNLDD